jgi:hypothetical protein
MTRSLPPAPVRFEPDLRVAEVDQRVQAGDAFEHDVAALAAIAAIGAAIFDIFLAAEADGTGAALTRTYVDLGLV